MGFFGGRTSRDGSEGSRDTPWDNSLVPIVLGIEARSIAAVGLFLATISNSAVVRRRKIVMAATGDGYLNC